MPECVKLLQQGEIIAYPTETFFALGCAMNITRAVEKIFCAKQREHNKPLPLLAANMQQVLAIADMNETEMTLAERFWPAPLTLLLQAKETVHTAITAGTGKVAVRISPHAVARELAHLTGVALVCSSANVSGNAAARCPQELDLALLPHIQGIVNEGEAPQGGLPSTIIEVLEDRSLSVRRHGALPLEKLQEQGFSIQPTIF